MKIKKGKFKNDTNRKHKKWCGRIPKSKSFCKRRGLDQRRDVSISFWMAFTAARENGTSGHLANPLENTWSRNFLVGDRA